MASKQVHNYDDNTDVNTTIDAQAAGKPALVYVHWWRCGHCLLTDAFFASPEAQAAARHDILKFDMTNQTMQGFINDPKRGFSLNKEEGYYEATDSLTGEKIPFAYTPTFLFINAEGKVVGGHFGAITSIEEYNQMQSNFEERTQASGKKAALQLDDVTEIELAALPAELQKSGARRVA